MTTAKLHSIREAAQLCEGESTVEGYDILDADVRDDYPFAQLEITVGPALERVPPEVCRILSSKDMGIRDVSPRPNGHFVVLAA